MSGFSKPELYPIRFNSQWDRILYDFVLGSEIEKNTPYGINRKGREGGKGNFWKSMLELLSIGWDSSTVTLDESLRPLRPYGIDRKGREGGKGSILISMPDL